MSFPTSRAVLCLLPLLVGFPCLAAELQPLPETSLEKVPEEARQEILDQRLVIDELLAADATDPQELAEAFGHLGKLYYIYGFSTVTDAAWSNAAALAPRDRRWHYYLGFLRRVEGDLDSAREQLLEALRLRPGDIPTLLLLAQVDIDLGELGSAAVRYNEVLADNPDSSAALYGLGRIAVSERRFEDAVPLLERALEGQPAGSVVHHQLGFAYRGLRELEKASEHLSLSRGVDIKARDPLMEQLASLAQGSHYVARTGLKLLDAGRVDQAVEHLERAVALDPGSAWMRYNLAVAYRKAERPEDSRRALLECLERDPDYAQAHFNLAYILAEFGDDEGAERHFRSAFELDRQDHRAHMEWAVALSRLGEEERALEELRGLMIEAPRFVEARLAYATLLAREGRGREALAVAQEALTLDATNAELTDASILVARLIQDADVSEAEVLYRRAVELTPDSEEGLFGLALMLGRQGRFPEAAEQFSALVAAYPLDADYRLGQAMAHLLAEDYPAARVVLEAATVEFPEHIDLGHTLARLLAACPDDTVRDGWRALELAQTTMSRRSTIEHAETLAMALAEVGRYAEAEELQQQVVMQREQVEGPGPSVDRSRRYLELYSRGETVRAPWMEQG